MNGRMNGRERVLLGCMKGSGLIKCVHTRHTAYIGPEEEIKYVGVWYRTC